MTNRAAYHVRLALLALGLLVIELAAGLALMTDQGQGPWPGLGFAMGHVAASAGAMLLWPFLPRVYQEGTPRRRSVPGQDGPGEPERKVAMRWLGRAMMFMLVFFLPVFGLLGWLLGVLPALYRPVQRRERDWRRVRIPPLPATLFDPRTRRLPVSQGTSIMDVFERADTEVDDRLAAALALRQLPTRPAVPILRVALRDPVDDVRLLAYAMLDRRDARLQARIQVYQRALKSSDLDASERRALNHALGELYWELAYTGLATGAVEARALESAARHARAALDAERPADGAAQTERHGERATLFLLGRILIRQGQLDEAERVLIQARARGFADASIRPYLAEIAFLRRDMASVKEHLRALGPRAHDRPGLIADLCRFWLAREA